MDLGYDNQIFRKIVQKCILCYKFNIMITVPQATEKIIKRSRYLTEAMSKDLINASSLARYIQPEVEEMTFKNVTHSSILMAIQRLQKEFKKERKSAVLLEESPDMIVRSNLVLFYVTNSPALLSHLVAIEEKSMKLQKRALFTYGRAETLILANRLTREIILKTLPMESITKQFESVSAITVHVPVMGYETPGLLNLFVKSLAWEGINLLGILTTESEVTLVIDTKDSNTAFSIFQGLFRWE